MQPGESKEEALSAAQALAQTTAKKAYDAHHAAAKACDAAREACIKANNDFKD